MIHDSPVQRKSYSKECLRADSDHSTIRQSESIGEAGQGVCKQRTDLAL